MADIKKEEHFADAALLLLLDEYAEQEGAALLAEYAENRQEMPDALDQACQARIRKQYQDMEKGALLRRTASRAAKAAVIALVCLFLSANLVLSVEALRVPFLNFCFETQRYFSSLTIWNDEDAQASSPDADTVSLPISAPTGYSISIKQHNHDDYSKIYSDSFLFLGYTNGDGHVLMIQTYPAAGTLSIDTEDAVYTQFLLNGMQAIHINKSSDGTLRTLWVDANRERIFDVSSDGLEEEEFSQYVFELSGMFMAPQLYAD